MKGRKDFFVTILDGAGQEQILNLAEFRKDTIYFGKNPDNDIVLSSPIVSRRHGYFIYDSESWVICDDQSMNGLFWNGTRIPYKRLVDQDKVLIGYENTQVKVAFLFSQESPQNNYIKVPITGTSFTIGRNPRCNIALTHVGVYKVHCRILFERGAFFLEPATPKAPIQYNGTNLTGRVCLFDMDRFQVGDTQFVYRQGMLLYLRMVDGLSFQVSHLSKIVGHGKDRKYINKDINFTVNAGEFVAIIGGSGAGKSTLLNCLCGISRISEGHVTMAGEDLTANYNTLKNLIGYVPQQDIVYDNLTLEKMLYYTARLRMPDDATSADIEDRIQKALEMVELTDRRHLLIRKLSGGQKKRASIAVELLSDPKLFFLDEPTSGLDPGTERNLMLTLKNMATKGKTVVLVTHTPLNLHLCDKIIILGYGGLLCYCGTPDGAKSFFGVQDLVDVYRHVNNNPQQFAALYEERVRERTGLYQHVDYGESRPQKETRQHSAMRQLIVLIRRYIALMLGDFRRILILLLMAPGLGILLYAAFRTSYPFEASYDTQKLALTLSCCAFWVGLFNTIQEICKESRIYERERMANLKLIPYVGSKIIVNALLDLVQSVLLTETVVLLLGMPETGMQMPSLPWLELFNTTFFTMLCASCLGLAVSAVVNNADQAISTAPLLLIPQILFSGVIVELQGVINKISYVVACRYACTAYCATADINNLPSEFKLTGLGVEAGETVIVDVLYSYSSNYSQGLGSIIGDTLAQKLTNPIAGGWFMLIILCLAEAAIALSLLKYKSRVK